eukprot:scaffold53967_cov47-Prasinocladus_malaysianus.AAC.1
MLATTIYDAKLWTQIEPNQIARPLKGVGLKKYGQAMGVRTPEKSHCKDRDVKSLIIIKFMKHLSTGHIKPKQSCLNIFFNTHLEEAL